MALLLLKRLPTEEELDQECSGLEAHSFLEAFNNSLVSGFSAKIGYDDKVINLDGWQWIHEKSDWYEVEM
ncbi:Uncharacterised protein [Serratia fonticola]|uniref:hypothetical protein n=1 Tax=Serratia fonticola TaxID=47917 RepID=UPI002179C52E|nr:hypothetical protein [Serratia fonticola]CAI1069667.1 Uncharacterised protein [Serratia fonticola]